MRLTPPADYSKLLIPLSIGVGLGVVFYTLTRSTLPFVGDNIHQLPHGGDYVDGTKKIKYCGPREKFPSSNLFSTGSLLVPVIIAALIAAIYASEKFFNSGPRVCRNCGGAAHN
ncbi:TGBp2 [Camellia ringspot associated virus 4]|uniref:Movement protein TGB2 n=1 Tax=Camellia ringspot associated virus 4 TaxID=2791164 RepID=A0A7S9TQG6_9VIRU|nr:TGBp2 [Camellia ringspot associated virus 4]QPI34840.1 TGBp2 [Camellia ringspot associated virus 4]